MKQLLLATCLAACSSSVSSVATPWAPTGSAKACAPSPQVDAPPADLRGPQEPAPVVAASPPSPSHRSRPPSTPRSRRLPSGWFNPMPGGVLVGYPADTGLDIAGNRQPVFAVAGGTLDYAERGHTLWTGPGDTPFTIRLRLDEPVRHRGRLITHVWYAHLSALRVHQPEGAPEPTHVVGGELLGVSGVANGSPHLHLGLLLDGEVEQHAGTYLLEDEVRAALGNLAHGMRLPGEPRAPLRAPAAAPDGWLIEALGEPSRDGRVTRRAAPSRTEPQVKTPW